MTHKQWLKIKDFIINANNYLNGISLTFNSLSNEFSHRTRLINTFSSCFSFHYTNHKSKESKATHICKLDEYMFYTSNNSKLVVMVSNTSIKNNVAISISYVHLFLNPIKKMIHHAVNIMSIKAELFAIRCNINKAIQIPNIVHITIIMYVFMQCIRYWLFNLPLSISIHSYMKRTQEILQILLIFGIIQVIITSLSTL